MIKSGLDSKVFEELIRELLEQGLCVRFEARGASMSPAIRDGELVEITPVIVSKLQKGDIVLVKSNNGFRLHRIVLADDAKDVFVTKGDCGQGNDPALKAEQILGRARAKNVRIGRTVVQAEFRGIRGRTLRSAARAQHLSLKLWRRTAGAIPFAKRCLTSFSVIGCLLLFSAITAGAQVAIDATTSASNEFTGAGTFALNFTHTTTATANRILIVGVSMNITNAPAAAVAGVTYNGTALTFAGAHNDTGNTRRVEMWYGLNPASGTNLAVSVSVNVPTAGATVGVVAGATTLTGVDQTLPLGSFVSADGAAGTNSQADVPSVVNGMIIDTLAIGGNRTDAPLGPQVQQWNASTASGTDPPGVTGTGSSRTGAPSVPIAETFSGASNWSLGALPVNPSTADIAVATSVSAVQLGQNSTFNITITNNGPSAANNVTLTDTFAATNLSLVSATPSVGTTCTTTTTINCTLPTPFASGATATLTVVVKTTAAGFYPNTATISDSGAPADPNTGNNSYVALAPVVSVVCSTNTPLAGGTLTGVVNTYFPGTANVGAGATSIPIGAATGAGGTIANGSLLLVIQMQDASINTSNSVAYGNGSTGAGFTTINNAGNYEFVKATGGVAGGLVPISGAGAGGGLVFGYTASAASATKGASTFQVVLVPQYSTATLGAVTASAWNGATGGILALDIAGQLNLGSATVSVDGLGFRGGAGMQLTGNGAGLASDFRFPSPAAYTGAAEAGADSAKGEGVAGTPEWVESGTTFLQTVTGVGYPSGTTGTDGSMAHGAPGNAGGGGTDAHPSANDQNAGGGGGGNGGSGGFGGDSWNTNLSTGGEGGGAFPATIDRIAMGGGGGAGTRNNSDNDTQASSGAAGGGIIFIRADSLTGSATLSANGAGAYNATANDAGGGGGAGGTIVVLAANGGESGLTMQANGGRGGNAWQSQAYSLANRHGPGGGGAGGVIFVSGASSSASVTGGGPGLTLNPGVSYGATAGNSGTTVTNATLGQVTGIQSAALCSSDMSLTKSHAGSFTRGAAASYSIVVSNVSPFGASSGLVTMNDTLPLGIAPTSASGTGWACSISGQTVSCTRLDPLPAASSYAAIALNAIVSQSAPATLTNIATVAGGGEFNLLNDTATDVASVVSSADLAITDAGSPNPVAAGANITYALLASNNGPSAADNATLVVTVPANTTFVSLAPPSGWSCQTPAIGANGNVVCTNANLAAPGSGAFTLVVKVNNGVANGTVITETASVSSSVSDPALSNNTARVNTIVGGSGPNLSVTNIVSPSPVQAGGTLTYTQVVTNTGSSAITLGTFSEATPANTTFASITPPAGWSCTGFPASPCTAATVAAGASGTFTVLYTVNALTPSGTTLTDTVTVNAANQSFGANSATATDIVATGTQADVALSTAASPNPVFAGNDITYTQTVTNSGPAAATGLVFTEATPTNTNFQSVLAPAGWSCTTPAVGGTGNIRCTDAANLASASAANIVVVVNVPANALSGTITANSSVASTTTDPNLANNSTTTATQVNLGCDLGVTNSGTPSPVAAGGTITYTQIVTNTGPSYCTNSTLTEATPANTAFVSVAVVTTGGGTWNCPNSAPIACSNASVPPGSTATITAIYRVNAGTAAGTIITDTATVSSGSPDTNGNNNSATVNIAVAGAGQADLSVTNSGSPNPVTAGNNITYTQSLTNGGPGPANAPVLTETLPPNTIAVSLTGPAGWNCVLASRTCTDTVAMAANSTANFTFVVTVNATVASGTILAQTDSVNSTTSDPNAANNSASVNTVVADSADLSLTNTPNPIPVQPGGVITYTQVVNNAGPTTATSVTLTNTLPANTTATSFAAPAGWTCTLATLTCTVATLAPGTPATITYRVTVGGAVAGGTQISETATVSSSLADPNSANNTATANDVVAASGTSDLVVTNSAAPVLVAAGSNVTYTQTVTNLGPTRATGTSFTQVTPPNTTFQSIAATGGFACGTTPVVGGTGTIICTHGANFTVGSSATFSLVLQVNSGTPSGTSITDTATATATTIVPNLTTNTASATVIVASANSADLAIVKTATPNPVTESTLLTYSLNVTNNGPASATTVAVTDTLPSVVTYLSSTTTQGSCSEAGGTVTCLLGTMANAATATVTILTIPGQPGVVTNTATVGADQTDPVPVNNTSIQTETITSPTWITLRSFSAHIGRDANGGSRVVLIWKTGGEAHNLGFNVYREVNGNRTRLNPSIIAGSALMMSGALPKHSGRTYAWLDPSVALAGASYWLEDIDVNGARTIHGPVSAGTSTASVADAPLAQARMLNQLNQAPPSGNQDSHVIEFRRPPGTPTREQIRKQFELAAHPAVQIYVKNEGWYRVAQPDLVRAGLDPNVDPSTLHLYAEANEQPIQITGVRPGPGGFGSQAAINFYGTGIDTVFSGTRVYWLVAGEGRGSRIMQLPAPYGSNQPPADYSTTVELRQHLAYFSALLTPDGQNFFGAFVSSTPLDQVLALPHLNANSTQGSRLEISLQGVMTGHPHDVSVSLNGTPMGDVLFTGQSKGVLTVDVPSGVLMAGNNTVTLTAQNGELDSSLAEYIRITYPHLYVADSDSLKFTGRAGEHLTVAGFTSAPVVLDITDPDRPVQLRSRTNLANGEYAIAVQVPFTTTNPSRAETHTLLAVASDRVASAAGVWPNHPSSWHSVQRGADIAMITHPQFADALAPLVRAHQAEGKTTAVVAVNDLYDEFNFGERSPFAIKQFLEAANQNWRTAPKYLLLNGRASLDPRNYLGFGELDLVPTRIEAMGNLMTASDDWFSDFKDSGMPSIPTGRLPVSTLDEATTVIGKVVSYEGKSTNGPWTSNALMVADKDDTESFTEDTKQVQAQLPATMQVNDIWVGTVGGTASTDIVNAINSGQLLVDYVGHGSEDQWSGSDIFSTTSVTSLTNASQLPVFLIMDCLNGFFQDVYAQPLGVTLLLAPNGGAVAVLASSGLNQPAPQTQLDILVVQNAFAATQLTLGDAILKAKSQITDVGVRQTYVLFGDPAMQVKRPATSSAAR